MKRILIILAGCFVLAAGIHVYKTKQIKAVNQIDTEAVGIITDNNSYKKHKVDHFETSDCATCWFAKPTRIAGMTKL